VASSARSGSAIKQIIIIVVLLLLLIALAVSYYLLTRPPQVEGQGERDRNFLFSIYGFEGDLLRRPTGVGIDTQGNIHVADTGKRRIVQFDADGNFIRVYGEAGREPLKLWSPIDVAVTPDGRSFVVDRGQSKLVEYDATGVAVRDIAIEEPPTSIEIHDDQMFVTTDSGVLIATLEGELQTGYISRGKEPGQFDRPAGVAVGQDGTLYIADSLNYRVQAIGTNGQPLWQYGEPIPSDQAIQFDAENRKFGLPASIAIDENELIYVVDGLNSEVVVMSTDGERIETIGDVGHEDGSFYYPDGIDYYDGVIVIADKFNDRVEVFRTPLPPGQEWRAFVPYAIGLLLLPLLLLPFLRRGRKYTLTPEVLPLLEADDDRDIVADALKRVFTTAELASVGSEIEDLKLRWVDKDPDEDKVADLADRFELDTAHAEALAIAQSLRGKRVLIAEDEPTIAAARELEVPVVTYEEIKRAITEDHDRKGGRKAAAAAAIAEEPVAEEPAAEEGSSAGNDDSGEEV